MQWALLGITAALVVVLLIERMRTQSAIREARSLFDLAPVSMVIIDPDGLVHVNRRVAALWGDESAGTSGRNLEDVLDARSAAELREVARSVLATGQRVEVIDTVLVRKGGGAVSCDLVASPVSLKRRPAVLVAFFPVDQKQAAMEALHQTEERFRGFFAELPVPAYRTTLDGEIIDFNRALLDLLEIEDESAIRGVNAADFYDDPAERRELSRRKRGKAPTEDRVLHLRTASGRDIRVRDMNRVVIDGEEPIFEGVAVDVTREERYLQVLERREQQQQVLAEIARTALRDNDVGHTLGDAVRKVGAVLRADCTMIAQRHDGLGLLATNVAYETDSVRQRESVYGYLADRVDSIPEAESVILGPESGRDGLADHNGILAVLSAPEEVFGVIAVAGAGFVATNEDRNFLSAVAATLGAAIARGRARDRMDQLMRSKDEFIASVSHELRTPLTVVAGLALELEQRWTTFSETELAELISLIAGESKEMGDLIEDLLVAARADIGKVPIYLDQIDLRRNVDQVLASCSLADRARISVAGHDVTGIADPVRFRQVVRNLVTNAIRYGGPRIHIELSAEGDGACVSVFDDGSGIPEADREKIFVPYEQAHTEGVVPGSVGLGLTVSRKLTELMHGSISYRYEAGSHFELRFPLVRSSVRVD